MGCTKPIPPAGVDGGGISELFHQGEFLEDGISV